jgi:ectoine hydroxylase-related dioxygenase (phytanoyl-CoA dioxygenase family)
MYFGTWVALEKTDRENGPLVVIPGSQRLPLLNRDAIAREKYSDLSQIKRMDNDLWNSYQGKIARLCQETGLKEEEVHVQKGDTIIWHPLLVHGGAKILDSARTRMSFVVHTTPKNIPVFHNDVFFNVEKPVVDEAPWEYDSIGGRFMMRTHNLSIGHANSTFDFAQLS